jgi:hypothetical protein
MRRLRLAAVTVIYAGKVTFVSGIVKVILKLSLSVPHYTWCGKRSLFAPFFFCAKDDHFTTTGSGQTQQEELRHKRAFVCLSVCLFSAAGRRLMRRSSRAASGIRSSSRWRWSRSTLLRRCVRANERLRGYIVTPHAAACARHGCCCCC